MPADQPLARHSYQPGAVEAVLEFLKRTRNELRTLRFVRVWTDRVEVFDVNGDFFTVDDIGYPHEDVVPILHAVNTAFKPEQIHKPVNNSYKEFKTGRRHPWAEDRVM